MTPIRAVDDIVVAAGRLVAWIARIVPLGPLHSKPMQAVLRRLRDALG